MTTTFADLEARVRGLESRAQRAEEDITAIVSTVMETRDDVKSLTQNVGSLTENVGSLTQNVTWLMRATQALLDHSGIDLDDSATGAGT